jgi:hypothetical protein
MYRPSFYFGQREITLSLLFGHDDVIVVSLIQSSDMMNRFHFFVCVLWIGTFYILILQYDGPHVPACQISVAVLLDSFLTARTEKAQEIQVLFIVMAQPFFKSCV